MATKADSPTKTCTKDGCTKALRARGLCGTHYNQAHHPNRHAKNMDACAYCGAGMFKASTGRYKNRVCSYECRANMVRLETIRARKTSTDLVGPVKPRRIKPLPAPEAEIPSTGWLFHTGPCAWCGEYFTAIQRGNQDHARCCSTKCAKGRARHAWYRHRGKHWITKRARHAIYKRDGYQCQLCGDQVDMTLEGHDPWAATLDHIIPQSKQVAPDHTPLNLRMAHRWCNSVRGDDTYYTAADLSVA